MPEKDFITWQAMAMIGSAIAGTFAIMLTIFRKPQSRSHTTESRVATLERELDVHKVNVAENYISRPTISAIVHSIERSMEEKLQRHTAELKLAIREAMDDKNK